MKKILHISKYYYPFVGGVEQIARDCVHALKDSCEQKVICFNHEKGDKEDEVDGIPVIRCGCQAKISSQSLSLSYRIRLKQVLQDYTPDYVVFHYPNPFVSHYLLKDWADSKLIVYWHLDITKQKILRKFFHRQTMHLLEQADKVIATSPNYIEGSPYLDMFRDKCVVVPNCINEKRLTVNENTKALADTIRAQYRNKKICLAVGRHVKYKGFEYLIKASEHLDSSYKIFLSGTGPLTPSLKQMASENDRMIFLGQIDDDTLKAYYLAADIFCFSSITKNEAFGVALAEAMYFKLPAVTFTIPGSGVNYVNIDGVTGLEVPNKDIYQYAEAIHSLGNDAALSKQYGKNGCQRVRELFLYERYAENIRNLIFGD